MQKMDHILIFDHNTARERNIHDKILLPLMFITPKLNTVKFLKFHNEKHFMFCYKVPFTVLLNSC